MKTQKKILVLLLVLALALSIVACGSSSDSLVGTWKITGGSYYDDDMLGDDSVSITFEYKKNGDFVMTMSLYGMSEKAEGTWKVSGSELTMTVDGDPLVSNYKVSGKTLTLTVDGETMVLTKQ